MYIHYLPIIHTLFFLLAVFLTVRSILNRKPFLACAYLLTFYIFFVLSSVKFEAERGKPFEEEVIRLIPEKAGGDTESFEERMERKHKELQNSSQTLIGEVLK